MVGFHLVRLLFSHLLGDVFVLVGGVILSRRHVSFQVVHGTLLLHGREVGLLPGVVPLVDAVGIFSEAGRPLGHEVVFADVAMALS